MWPPCAMPLAYDVTFADQVLALTTSVLVLPIQALGVFVVPACLVFIVVR